MNSLKQKFKLGIIRSVALQRIRKNEEATPGKRWSECAKKNRYEDEAEVQRVINRRAESGAMNLRYYECRFCDGFHITKKDKQ